MVGFPALIFFLPSQVKDTACGFWHEYHFMEVFSWFIFLTKYINSFCCVHIVYEGPQHIVGNQRMLAEFLKYYYRLDVNSLHPSRIGLRGFRGKKAEKEGWLCLTVPDKIIGKKVQGGIQEVFKTASATFQGTNYRGWGHIHSFIHS